MNGMTEMQIPSYYLSRPDFELTPEMREEFEALFEGALALEPERFIEYTSTAPKWQFLSFLAENKDVLFHGTGDPAITEFEPRQSISSTNFGNQEAVYAASDALWASYFAVIDRPRVAWSLVNTCNTVVRPDGSRAAYYYFSINDDALRKQPWRTGTIYILPRAGFETGRPGRFCDMDTESAEWRSFEAVKPLAKISVAPDDFPLLSGIRGHDFETVKRRAQADPSAFPWLEG